MKIKALFPLHAAPGCSHACAAMLSQDALDKAVGKLTAVEGAHWTVESIGAKGLSLDFQVFAPLARETLSLAYLDYFNNYLTVDTYADHHGLSPEHAKAFLELARAVHEAPHPES